MQALKQILNKPRFTFCFGYQAHLEWGEGKESVSKGDMDQSVT